MLVTTLLAASAEQGSASQAAKRPAFETVGSSWTGTTTPSVCAASCASLAMTSVVAATPLRAAIRSGSTRYSAFVPCGTELGKLVAKLELRGRDGHARSPGDGSSVRRSTYGWALEAPL